MIDLDSRRSGPQHVSCFTRDMNDDRRSGERRRADRRLNAGEALDVTRIEHDNLAAQVAANVRSLHRIEHELRALRAMIEQGRNVGA